MIDTPAARAKLEKRLDSLTRRITASASELGAEHTRDLEDQAIEREVDEVLVALSEQDQKEVSRIKAALARIDAGTYGTCLECGEDISPERLEVLPATTMCRSCARSREDMFDNMPV